MSKSSPSTTTVAPCGCGDAPVPLSVLGLELDPPVGMSLRTWLADDLVTDDLGRVAVPRSTARRLIAERDAALAQQAERAERNRAQLADLSARIRPPAGIPVPDGMEDAGGVAVLLSVDRDAKLDRRRTAVDEMLGGELRYHPVGRD